jgi:hypothetical protein
MELVVPAVLAALGYLAVVAALLRDSAVPAPVPPQPDWDPLPTPADLARTDFGLRVPGYDPVTVDTAFETLAQAYADLLVEADPAAVARARRRAEERLAEGADHTQDRRARPSSVRPRDGVGGWRAAAPDPAEPAGPADTADPPAGALGSPAAPDGAADALRAEAALDALRQRSDADRP